MRSSDHIIQRFRAETVLVGGREFCLDRAALPGPYVEVKSPRSDIRLRLLAPCTVGSYRLAYSVLARRSSLFCSTRWLPPMSVSQAGVRKPHEKGALSDSCAEPRLRRIAG